MTRKDKPARVRVRFPSGATGTVSPEFARKWHYPLLDTEVKVAEEVLESPEPPPAKPEPTAAEIRAWARENDVPCPKKGKVPASVVEAYHNASN